MTTAGISRPSILVFFDFSFDYIFDTFDNSITTQGDLENVLVAGTLDGCLVGFDTSRMDVAWKQSLGCGYISCMEMMKDKDSMIAVTQSGKAFVLDVKTGVRLAQWECPEQLAVTRMASLPDGRILLAGNGVVLVDSTTGVVVGTWAGHATPVIVLVTEGAYFCSVAAGDRTVAIWNARLKPSGKIMHKSVVSRIPLNHPVSSLCIFKASHSTFHVVAVTLPGSIHVFKCLDNTWGKGNNPTQVIVQEWARSESGGLPVVHCVVDGGGEDTLQVSFVYGTFVKPIFSSLTLSVPQNGSIVQIVKPNSETEMLMKNTATQGHALNVKSKGFSVVNGGRPGYTAMQDFDSVESEDEGDIDMDMENNMTFGERIAGLVEADIQDTTTAPEQGSIPHFDSLSVLLSQAISNGDDQFLEKCISLKSSKTISETARHLSPRDATVLIGVLVRKLQASPSRGSMLALWIKALLIHHVAYISGTGVCKKSLGHLYQTMDTRLALHGQMMSLHSRLGLILASAEHVPYQEIRNDCAPLTALYLDENNTVELMNGSGVDTTSSQEELLSSDNDSME